MIYYIVLVVLIIATFLFDFFKVKPAFIEKKVFIFLSICLFLMAALRNDTGYDYISYQIIFNNVKSSSLDFLNLYKQIAYEPLFFLLMYTCRFFSFKVFIFIVSAICVLPKTYFIYKINTNKYLMLVCYYCSVFLSFDMGIIRQGLSFSIILFSIKYVKERKPVKFVVIVLIASFFHTSSIIFLSAYLLGKKETRDRTIISGVLLSFVLSVMSNQNVLNEILNVIASKIPIIGNKIVELIHFYNASPQYKGQGLSLTTLLKRAFVMFVLIVIRKFNEYKNNSEKNISIFNISINCYFLSILFAGLLSGNGIMASRGTYALYMFQIPCFALAAGEDKTKTTYHLFLLVLSVLLFYFTFNGLVNDPIEAYLPYKTIFQK